VVAPKVGETKLADGTTLEADGQLAGTPSVLFDAVVTLLSESSARRLAGEAAAVDFVRDAFGHLKAIGFDATARPLLNAARVADDAGIVDVADLQAFIQAAKTRQWGREGAVRTLA
jgi:catalase